MVRKFIMPLLAIVLAGAAALYARALIDGQNQELVADTVPQDIIRLSVLVADEDLAPGSFVKTNSLRWQEWPEVDLPQTYMVLGENSPDDLDGGVVREKVLRGQPIIASNIVLPGDRGFLAAVLNQGMRAISVPVDDASSHAGLIFPGDYVDLILTQSVQQEENDIDNQRRASETVLRNIRVIAMGRALSVDPDEFNTSSAPQVRTATLEVWPADAEIVALVSEMGKLSLSLRSLARDSQVLSAEQNEKRSAIWDFDVSAAFDGQSQGGVNMRIIRPSGIQEVESEAGGARQ